MKSNKSKFMKKVILILASVFFLNCSSSDDNTPKQQDVSNISQIQGTWKLTSSVANSQTQNTATSCQIEKSGFIFSEGTAVESKGIVATDNTCNANVTNKNLIILNGVIRLEFGANKYVYNAKINNSKLELQQTSYSNSSGVVSIPPNNQILNIYTKQ